MAPKPILVSITIPSQQDLQSRDDSGRLGLIQSVAQALSKIAYDINKAKDLGETVELELAPGSANLEQALNWLNQYDSKAIFKSTNDLLDIEKLNEFIGRRETEILAIGDVRAKNALDAFKKQQQEKKSITERLGRDQFLRKKRLDATYNLIKQQATNTLIQNLQNQAIAAAANPKEIKEIIQARQTLEKNLERRLKQTPNPTKESLIAAAAKAFVDTQTARPQFKTTLNKVASSSKNETRPEGFYTKAVTTALNSPLFDASTQTTRQRVENTLVSTAIRQASPQAAQDPAFIREVTRISNSDEPPEVKADRVNTLFSEKKYPTTKPPRDIPAQIQQARDSLTTSTSQRSTNPLLLVATPLATFASGTTPEETKRRLNIKSKNVGPFTQASPTTSPSQILDNIAAKSNSQASTTNPFQKVVATTKPKASPVEQKATADGLLKLSNTLREIKQAQSDRSASAAAAKGFITILTDDQVKAQKISQHINSGNQSQLTEELKTLNIRNPLETARSLLSQPPHKIVETLRAQTNKPQNPIISQTLDTLNQTAQIELNPPTPPLTKEVKEIVDAAKLEAAVAAAAKAAPHDTKKQRRIVEILQKHTDQKTIFHELKKVGIQDQNIVLIPFTTYTAPNPPNTSSNETPPTIAEAFTQTADQLNQTQHQIGTHQSLYQSLHSQGFQHEDIINAIRTVDAGITTNHDNTALLKVLETELKGKKVSDETIQILGSYADNVRYELDKLTGTNILTNPTRKHVNYTAIRATLFKGHQLEVASRLDPSIIQKHPPSWELGIFAYEYGGRGFVTNQNIGELTNLGFQDRYDFIVLIAPPAENITTQLPLDQGYTNSDGEYVMSLNEAEEQHEKLQNSQPWEQYQAMMTDLEGMSQEGGLRGLIGRLGFKAFSKLNESGALESGALEMAAEAGGVSPPGLMLKAGLFAFKFATDKEFRKMWTKRIATLVGIGAAIQALIWLFLAWLISKIMAILGAILKAVLFMLAGFAVGGPIGMLAGLAASFIPTSTIMGALSGIWGSIKGAVSAAGGAVSSAATGAFNIVTGAVAAIGKSIPVTVVATTIGIGGGGTYIAITAASTFLPPDGVTTSSPPGRYCWPASGMITQDEGPPHYEFNFADWGHGQAFDIGPRPVNSSDTDYRLFAPFNGTVNFYRQGDPGGFPGKNIVMEPLGNYAIITGSNGLIAIFMHLDQASSFSLQGESFTAGQELPGLLIDSTGNSTGTHLHYEVFGTPIRSILPPVETDVAPAGISSAIFDNHNTMTRSGDLVSSGTCMGSDNQVLAGTGSPIRLGDLVGWAIETTASNVVVDADVEGENTCTWAQTYDDNDPNTTQTPLAGAVNANFFGATRIIGLVNDGSGTGSNFTPSGSLSQYFTYRTDFAAISINPSDTPPGNYKAVTGVRFGDVTDPYRVQRTALASTNDGRLFLIHIEAATPGDVEAAFRNSGFTPVGSSPIPNSIGYALMLDGGNSSKIFTNDGQNINCIEQSAGSLVKAHIGATRGTIRAINPQGGAF